ncbi:unnamed protein product [Effrenium voratum]|uniref:Uncharacterized protein n=1 Tax=Effrenium voratum TaxID=2562239 RepID=A0AA36J5D3_9DINO|nr:unnamed protein product [Effrenium voratum]
MLTARCFSTWLQWLRGCLAAPSRLFRGWPPAKRAPRGCSAAMVPTLLLLPVLAAASLAADCDNQAVSAGLLQSSRWTHTSSVSPAIGLVKTHKTAGSTLSVIFERLALHLNRSILLPTCEDPSHLGYPDAFPGEAVEKLHGGPRHQFDMVLHHAVFNKTSFNAYLRPAPFFVSILRDPSSHVVSVYNFFRKRVTPRWGSIDDFISYLKAARQERPVPRYVNFHAHDLGFYEAGYTPNASSREVKEFVSTLLPSFSLPTGLMMMTEFFDEGLILLKTRLNLPLSAVSYYSMKTNHKSYEYPSDHQLQQMLQLASNIDLQVYPIFNQSFASAWQMRTAAMDEELTWLKARNEALNASCHVSETEPPCAKEFTVDSDCVDYDDMRMRLGIAACEKKPCQ